jgi:16S rRNA (adenine(1408)-N(1))-methyltransferase
METIRGRTSHELDLNGLKRQQTNYDRILLDLGTGDGRFARTLAERHPGWFVIGIDACRENLREHSQARLENLLFIIASAQDLPRELNGCAAHMIINFPWGSLLESLLSGDPALLQGLEAVTCPRAALELRLNGGALAEANATLEAGAHTIRNNLVQAGWRVKTPLTIDGIELRNFPSTWAKRLAFGRDPRAMLLSAQK